jgi:flagellar biogenesis protein FliO
MNKQSTSNIQHPTPNIQLPAKRGGFGCSMLDVGCWMLPFFFALTANAQTTNSVAAPLVAPSLPDASVSFIRVIGALALVIGLFLGGVWLFRNWQRLAVQRGHAPKLNILETRSLGGRHAIYVVGYNQERFLISSSPGGVNFLSHLPGTTEAEPDAIAKNSPTPSFAQALTQVLKGK